MNHCATLFVGLGSAVGDDQVGLCIAERLVGRVSVPIKQARTPSKLLDWLDGVERLVVCDACQSPHRPGTLLRWRWPDDALLQAEFRGTHDLALVETLTLAQRTGALPARVEVLGVTIALPPQSDAISTEIAAAIPELVEAIAEIVGHA